MHIQPFAPTRGAPPPLWTPPRDIIKPDAPLWASPQCWRGRKFPQPAIYGKGAGGGGGGVAFKWRNAQDNSFVGGNTSVNVGATSPAFSNGSFTAGDVLLASVTVESDPGDTIVPPSGWNLVGTLQTSSTNYITSFFSHICNGSESGSFTFTWTNSHFFGWTLVNYSGAAASPIDGTPVTGTGTTSITTGSVTTSNAASILVLVVSGPSNTFTPPGDLTARFNAAQISSTMFGFIGDRTPGSTGTFTETFSIAGGSADANYMLIALHP